MSHKLMIIFAEKKRISKKKCILAAENNRQIINRRDKYDYNSIIRSA